MTLSHPSKWSNQRGLTLVEVIIGLMIIVLAATSVFFALGQMNKMASAARLATAAQFIVQSNIDTIQSDSPFVPQSSQVPAELTLGTTSSNSVPIYVDPASGQLLASGTLTTTVTNISSSSLNEYAYLATVQLSYKYRNTNYQILASTVRGSDQ